MRRRDEEGSSLLMVLVVITVVAVALSALLTRSDAAQKVTKTLREEAAASYTADGAMQAAINNLRNSSYNGEPGQRCFGLSDTLSLLAFDGLNPVAVKCQPDPKQVIVQCETTADCNRPDNAILALSTIPGETAISVSQPAASTFRVHGKVFANSSIDVSAGSLSATGSLSARGVCSGGVLAPLCGLGGTPQPDPAYTPAVATVPAHRSLPACTTPNSVVTFTPGYYDDADGLSTMMGATSPCHHSTWWFKPGAYYFDFHNTTNPLLAGTNTWTVATGTLVAGAPVNAAGAVIAAPPVPATVPGSCASPLGGSSTGVQFIFGGTSRLAVESGKAELCGSYSASKPPIAAYGLTSGSETVSSDVLKPTAVSLLSKFGLSATPGRLGTVDGQAASWKSTVVNDTAGLTLSGYNQAGAIPVGSVLESAELKITHRHSDPLSTDKLDVSVDVGAGAPLVASVIGRPGGPAYEVTTIPLDAARTGSLARAIYGGGFTGATISLTAGLASKDDTEDIDAIRIELSYREPSLRKGSGCVVEGPYPANGCALISGNVAVDGTVYAPEAALDLTVAGGNRPIVEAGLVIRALRVSITGSLTGVAIDLPDVSPGFTFGLHLSVYLCPGALVCVPSGRPALQAKIGLVDADPASPDAGRRKVTVLGWWRPG
jgi:type II secretory pathway pseudopilin PulG